MSTRFFNGLQIDVPDDWADLSTVIVAPREESGRKPLINLVVKRRPARDDTEGSLREYLGFMKSTFGDLGGLETRDVQLGGVRGRAVRFQSKANGKTFRQTTLLYQLGDDEISATVTQIDGDQTPAKVVEKMLFSVRPAAGSLTATRVGQSMASSSGSTKKKTSRAPTRRK